VARVIGMEAAVKRPGIRKSMLRQSMLLTKDQLDDMKAVFNTVCHLRFYRINVTLQL